MVETTEKEIVAELPEEGFSNIKGKLWKVWFGKVLSVEEKIAHTFNDDQRKLHKVVDMALKSGMIRLSESIMLIIVRDLEQVQTVLDWTKKFHVKPKVGDTVLMYYGRYGYSFPDLSFGKMLKDGFNVDIQE